MSFSLTCSTPASTVPSCVCAPRNSALMHQGARGYLMQSDVQRRVREAQFVAIVTPAIKHLRKESCRASAPRRCPS
jgi:hypothetical protein